MVPDLMSPNAEEYAMRHTLRPMIGLGLWCAIGIVQGQALEVIPLQHRTAEQVLPVLQPLVEAGGTLTGMNDRLFLITSPRNRADIERVLAAIDTPATPLTIRVTQDRQLVDSERGARVRGEIVVGSDRQASGEVRVWDTRSQRDVATTQMVRTVDGGRAFIQVGRSLPLPMRDLVVRPDGVAVREHIVHRDVASGFHAEPRLRGDRVTVRISQQADEVASPGSHPTIDIQTITTTVEGALGEWIELGGSDRTSLAQQGGSFSAGRSDQRDNRSIWIKIERAEP